MRPLIFSSVDRSLQLASAQSATAYKRFIIANKYRWSNETKQKM